jgi:uncharacterized protein (DUF1684 family)
MSHLRRLVLAVFPLLLLPGCSSRSPAAGNAAKAPPAEMSDSAYVASVQTWQKNRQTRLESETGWLSIVGLDWLEPGENVFGSDPKDAVPFPEGSAPPRAGVIRLDAVSGGTEITVKADPGVVMTVNDTTVTERTFRLGHEESSDTFTLGRIRFAVIERGGRYGARVRDPQSPIRTGFTGIEAYPIDRSWRVQGTLLPAPGKIAIANVLGDVDSSLTPGPVQFAINGETHRLWPTIEAPADSELFFVFGDATNGGETYGAGRFLYADLKPDNSVVLDFNEAYNPPCAFNQYTTCPLPPEGNRLPIAVRAGEKAYQGPQ